MAAFAPVVRTSTSQNVVMASPLSADRLHKIALLPTRGPADGMRLHSLLAKQQLNVRFIINDKNKEAHACALVLAIDAAVRGRMIRNSVNSPGFVSTSISPACCFTMMS